MTSPIVPNPDHTHNFKRCTQCGIEHPYTAEYFHRTKRTSSGLQAYCKQCACARTRAYNETHKEEMRQKRVASYLADPEKHREAARKWNREHADANREKNRRRYAEDPEPQRAAARAYRASHLEERRAYDRLRAPLRSEKTREWKRAYYAQPKWKERRMIYKHRRRALEAGAEGRYTPEDLAAIRAAQTDKKGQLICWHCGEPITDAPHLDHWIPLRHGGSNDAGNLHYMHATCNRKKCAKLPEEIGRLI